MSSEGQEKAAPNKPGRETDLDQPLIYQIRVKSHLDFSWKDWFEGLKITLEENGDMLLTGPVVDQAALYGLLKKVRDLGMPLVSLHLVEPDPAGTGHDKRSHPNGYSVGARDSLNKKE